LKVTGVESEPFRTEGNGEGLGQIGVRIFGREYALVAARPAGAPLQFIKWLQEKAAKTLTEKLEDREIEAILCAIRGARRNQSS
jgi:hypothetical protein